MAEFDQRPFIVVWQPGSGGIINQAPLRFPGMGLRFQKYPAVVSDMLCRRSGVYLGLLASKDWSEPPHYNLESVSRCPAQAAGGLPPGTLAAPPFRFYLLGEG